MTERKGFLPDGSGPDGCAFGRDPDTGRAYKRNGTVRKSRTVKTPEEQLTDLAAAEKRAEAGMGRKILASMGRYSGFLGAFGKFRSWVTECKSHATPEAIAKRREALEQQLADLEAKQEAAQAFLAEQGEAIAQANGVFANVGRGYIAFNRANGRAPNAEEGEAIVSNVVDAEAVEAVERSSDPANDPFIAFRRDAPSVETNDDDDDTL